MTTLPFRLQPVLARDLRIGDRIFFDGGERQVAAKPYATSVNEICLEVCLPERPDDVPSPWTVPESLELMRIVWYR
jgi:hypothetical protein